MNIKVGINVIFKGDGTKATIINIIDKRVEILDYGTLVPWFVHIGIAQAILKPIEE